ncbi:uncharacterized protein LOC132734770 [Ruditapes philippinarum]|uniref:uncharacterized protein LOC132734770 n=1 Tax=Ruditapes philippinarum TaxID=129788 RepID=UPI00295B4B66|nr:uncharacterized protein LOC132734770 [Ruditapes philippinarum]
MDLENKNKTHPRAAELDNKTNEELSYEESLFIEYTPNHVKVLFVCVCITSLFCSCVSLTVLKRTRRIPHAAKFLSAGLLCFDSLYMTVITIRKFIQEPLLNTTLQVLSTTLLQLGYVTVTFMSVERFFMFFKPMKYIAKCTPSYLRLSTITIWVATVTVFQIVRYGACYVKFESRKVFNQAGLCNRIVTVYYLTLVVLSLSISMLCYWSIFNMVKRQLAYYERKKVSFTMMASFLRSYKSTTLVLVYILVIFVTSFVYAIIILYIRYMNLDVRSIRTSLEVVSAINCFINPFLYVMWFKESQMEAFKLFSCFNKNFKTKAEAMKYEIFDIVTSYQHVTSTV